MARGRGGPIIVGITGGLGTGKSTVAKLFGEWRHVKVLDADRIAHDVMEPQKLAWRKILERFGDDVVHSETDQRINRKKLAARVFDDPDALRDLEAIVHPRVLKALQAQLAKLRRDLHLRMVVVEVPLLFETDAQHLVDHVIVVTAPLDVVAQRLRAKGMTDTDAAQRQAAQLDLSAKVALADSVIDNSGDREQTRRQVTARWDQLVNTQRRPRRRGSI